MIMKECPSLSYNVMVDVLELKVFDLFIHLIFKCLNSD